MPRKPEFFTRVGAHMPGKHSQKTHGGGGGDGDDDGDDPFYQDLPGGKPGSYGFGVDPSGKSYTEHDVGSVTGEPRFSQEYRDKYGRVESETDVGSEGGKPLALVVTEKKGLHIADDSNGTIHREVVQELSSKQAGEVGDAVWSVYNGDQFSAATPAGVTVRPAGDDPTRDGVVVGWSNGREDTFDGEAGYEAAFTLQEHLSMAGGTNRARFYIYANIARARARAAENGGLTSGRPF